MFRRPFMMWSTLVTLATLAVATAPCAFAQSASVTLSWTAPGDDGAAGTATQY
jgi:hypothetical protein